MDLETRGSESPADNYFLTRLFSSGTISELIAKAAVDPNVYLYQFLRRGLNGMFGLRL